MRFCPAFHVVQLMRQASRFVLSNLEIEESSYPKPIWPGTVLLDRKHPDWLACYPQQGEFLVLRLVTLCKSAITISELYGIKRDPWLYSELLLTNASLEYLTLGPLGCEPGTPNSWLCSDASSSTQRVWIELPPKKPESCQCQMLFPNLAPLTMSLEISCSWLQLINFSLEVSYFFKILSWTLSNYAHQVCMMRLIPNSVTIEKSKKQSVIQHNECEYKKSKTCNYN